VRDEQFTFHEVE